MRHLSDTGKQIEAHMRQKHPGASSLEHEAELADAQEAEVALEERPQHPIAAMGAAFMVVAALVLALSLTAIAFLAAIVAVPIAIAGCALLLVWAFWGWEHRKRQARADSGAAST